MESVEFEAALSAIPEGYSEGIHKKRRYGVTFRRSQDGRRNTLFARELAGTDIVSFNLYRVGSGDALLKPCEMSGAKVRDFILGYEVDVGGQTKGTKNPTRALSPTHRGPIRK